MTYLHHCPLAVLVFKVDERGAGQAGRHPQEEAHCQVQVLLTSYSCGATCSVCVRVCVYVAAAVVRGDCEQSG